MEDIVRQLVGYARAMALPLVGLLAAWVIGIAAAVGIYMLPDRYESSARIFVDTQSVLKPLMSGLAVQPNIDQQVTILSRTLISRPNIEKLIRMADLDLAIKNDKDREALIDKMTRSLAIRSTGRDNLFAVVPGRASRTRAPCGAILRLDLRGVRPRRQAQGHRYRAALHRGADQRLRTETRGGRKSPEGVQAEEYGDDGRGTPRLFCAVVEGDGRTRAGRLQLRESENSRDALKRQLLGEEPVLLPQTQKPSLSSVSIPEIDGRIETLKKNLDAMLQRFTEAHPDVVGTRRVITQLEGRSARRSRSRARMPPRSLARSIRTRCISR